MLRLVLALVIAFIAGCATSPSPGIQCYEQGNAHGTKHASAAADPWNICQVGGGR